MNRKLQEETQIQISKRQIQNIIERKKLNIFSLESTLSEHTKKQTNEKMDKNGATKATYLDNLLNWTKPVSLRQIGTIC